MRVTAADDDDIFRVTFEKMINFGSNNDFNSILFIFSNKFKDKNFKKHLKFL